MIIGDAHHYATEDFLMDVGLINDHINITLGSLPNLAGKISIVLTFYLGLLISACQVTHVHFMKNVLYGKSVVIKTNS